MTRALPAAPPSPRRNALGPSVRGPVNVAAPEGKLALEQLRSAFESSFAQHAGALDAAGAPAPDSPNFDGARQLLAQVAQLYVDDRLTGDEVQLLLEVREKLQLLVDGRLVGVWSGLDFVQQDQLEKELLFPVRQFIDATANSTRAAKLAAVEAFNHTGVPESFQRLDPRQLPPPLEGRYALGDLVFVPRSNGTLALGMVDHVEPDGRVRLRYAVDGQFPTPGKQLVLKVLTPAQLAKVSCFKPGEYLEGVDLTQAFPQEAGRGTVRGRVWFEGVDEWGGLRATAVIDDATGALQGAQGRQLSLRAADLARLEPEWLAQAKGLRVPQAVPGVGFRSQTQAPLPVERTRAPTTGDAVDAVLAGPSAQKVDGIQLLEGAATRVASYTSAGPSLEAQGVVYLPFNEDGTVAFLVAGDPATGRPEVAAGGVFDMAGGLGKAEGEPGKASEVAAACFRKAAADIAAGADPRARLEAAVAEAHREIVALGIGAGCTFCAGVVVTTWENGRPRRTAHLVNVGDSRALVVGRDGSLRTTEKFDGRTPLHNAGARNVAQGIVSSAGAMAMASTLTRRLGGSSEPTPDYFEVPLEVGDRVVFVTDGLCGLRELEARNWPFGDRTWHADVATDDLRRIIGAAGSDDQVVQALVGCALDQMADGLGKADNLGVVCLGT